MRAVKTVLQLLLALLALYSLLRLCFLLLHFREEHTVARLASLFYWGLRLDLAALVAINLPFIIFHWFIQPYIRITWGRNLALLLFLLPNVFFLALNLADLFYYSFNQRRSTIDLLSVLSSSGSAIISFVGRQWYVPVLFLLVAYLLCRYARRLIWNQDVKSVGGRTVHVARLITLILLLVLARGLKTRPLLPTTPLLYFDARFQPLVNNSSLNFLYSAFRRQTVLPGANFFNEASLDELVPIGKQYMHDTAFSKRNVVVFILESFSLELFKDHRQQSHLPFLDSLMQHSTVCTNAFANAMESNKGLPAILASLPEVMDEPVYLSNYSNFKFDGIGHLLKREGYNTSFFLGAEHDHFGFAKLCRMVGLDEYYSADTYPGSGQHHDGNWGIADEYFFSYFLETIRKTHTPFFAVLYNLSSHDPYEIPAATAKRINVPGQRPHQNAATYVDDSFRALFAQLSNQPWFSNTLFVFVADHGYRYEIRPDQTITELRIPLFVYDPSQPKYHEINSVVQQLDVVPSILDKLSYSKPFHCLGNSFFSQPSGYSVSRLNGVFQVVDSVAYTGYDMENDRIPFMYHYRSDSLLQNNLVPQRLQDARLRIARLQAMLQRVMQGLKRGSLH